MRRPTIHVSDRMPDKVLAKRQLQEDINLGNSIVLDYRTYPDVQIPVPNRLDWFGENDFGVVGQERLVTGKVSDLPPSQQGPGSWVVTLNAEIVRPGPAPASMLLACP